MGEQGATPDAGRPRHPQVHQHHPARTYRCGRERDIVGHTRVFQLLPTAVDMLVSLNNFTAVNTCAVPPRAV